FDRAGALASWESGMRAESWSFRHEPEATLGDSIALFRLFTSASGYAGRTLDVGAYESEHFVLLDGDAAGRSRFAERFTVDHLGSAMTRLYERYAELLPECSERERAAATS